ncbi:hypothetical protein IHE44_0015183 [Lamprotornis superbus]|uniref:Uncharacterized protein n=1 Tax=Lamprotornis superbus TaxID=245042 RepID=A0A835TQN1_9PASS|nr:hypothetical protein IHE44_0015183 [Lamprotornis superbus]
MLGFPWKTLTLPLPHRAPHLGRELVCKESKKTFKATIAMSQEFPLGIESITDIPVFPTITATVTFQEFRYDEFHDSIFSIPDDYKEDPSRFPDL